MAKSAPPAGLSKPLVGAVRRLLRPLVRLLIAKGVPKENIEEEYTPFNHQDYQTIVGKIKRFASGGIAAVLSTINGDSNVPFYKEFAKIGRAHV